MSSKFDKFLRLFSDPAPALRVKFRESDATSKLIPVHHRLGSEAGTLSREFLDPLQGHTSMSALREFYCKHDGAELCKTLDARFGQEKPLLEFKPAKSIGAFTRRYAPGGDLSWTMELNKCKALYRSSATWLAFAETDSGPACLTIFLDGQDAGRIYYATPQPPFNILRPIARDFQALLDRVAKDLPAFLRLVRATVTLRGADGDNYGYMPVEYLANIKEGAEA